MARILFVFAFTSWVVSGLRLRDGMDVDTDGAIETFLGEDDGLARAGATMTVDIGVKRRLSSRAPPASQGSTQGLAHGHPGHPVWSAHGEASHHHAADEEGVMQPDTWLHCLEHGHLISHMLDNQTLWDFTHATTGDAPDHYEGETAAIPKYNIPSLKMQHAVPGFRARNEDEKKRVTVFPSYLCLASSWDKALVYEVSLAVSKEFKTLGANVMLGPSINIHRATQHDEEFDSLSGEDPTLGSVLVRSWILGTQTHGIMSVPNYIGRAEQAPVHFENSSANITSWDIYYPPFQAAADTGAAGLMCASHEINGLWSCRDKDMLVRDLRHIMSFHGMVVSDVNSAREYFKFASSFERGLDLEIAETIMVPWTKHEEEGMRKAASRVVAAIWRMKFEENPGCQPPNCKEELSATATSSEHRQIAKVAAASGVVLLKNMEDILPIKSGPVAVIDVIAPGPDYCVYDPERGENETCLTPFKAIESHGADLGITVTSDMTKASTCVVVGESTASTHWRVDSSTEVAIKLASTTCVYIVVLLQTRGAVLTPWRDDLAALAVLHHTGEEASYAWACMLFGDCNPSGKLAISFPEKEEDMSDWWNEQIPSYWDPTIKFAYPFGHGESYAKFYYSEIKDKPGCKAPLCIQVDVTNIHPTMAGQEVVQVYFRFGEQEHHPVVLRGFYKTRVLPPGEFERVFFPFSFRDLSLYHDVNNHTEPEESFKAQHAITVMVGSSSRDIRRQRVEHPRGIED